MKRISNKAVTLLFGAAYFISYISRINYGALIVEMVADTGFSNAALSIALTVSSITYGVGQIISGFIGDKIQPKGLVCFGLIISAFVNSVVPFCNSPLQMTVFWGINGFAQAMMWPPMVRLMVGIFNDNEYRKASVKVCYGSSLGTIAVFLISPILISASGWRSVFWFSGICTVAMIIIWQIFCPKISDYTQNNKVTDNHNQKTENSHFKVDVIFILIMLAIVLQGALRDGVTTWTPTYINDMFALGSALSILTSVALPIFSMLCHGFGGWLYYKVFKSPILAAAVIFGVGGIASFILYIIGSKSSVVSVICLAFLVGAMHGVNLMLICMVPAFYKNTGKISLISGLLNSCTYIGSAVSTYGVAVLTEKSGWSVTVIVWTAIAFLGAIICFAIIPKWNKKWKKLS